VPWKRHRAGSRGGSSGRRFSGILPAARAFRLPPGSPSKPREAPSPRCSGLATLAAELDSLRRLRNGGTETDSVRSATPDKRHLAGTHPSYRVFAKASGLPRQFDEYVTCVNPGENDPYLLSVSMSTNGHPAPEEELTALQSIVGSLAMLSGKTR